MLWSLAIEGQALVPTPDQADACRALYHRGLADLTLCARQPAYRLSDAGRARLRDLLAQSPSRNSTTDAVVSSCSMESVHVAHHSG